MGGRQKTSIFFDVERKEESSGSKEKREKEKGEKRKQR